MNSEGVGRDEETSGAWYVYEQGAGLPLAGRPWFGTRRGAAHGSITGLGTRW